MNKNYYKQEIEKIAASYSEDTDTNFLRDRLAPEVKRDIKMLPAALVGGAIGGGLGHLAMKKNPGLAMLGGTIGSAALAGLQRNHTVKKDINKLSKMYKNEINKEEMANALEKSHHARKVSNGLMAASAFPITSGPANIARIGYSLSNTPEAIFQKARKNSREE